MSRFILYHPASDSYMYAHSEDERDALLQSGDDLIDVSDDSTYTQEAEKRLGVFDESANMHAEVETMKETIRETIEASNQGPVELMPGVTIVSGDAMPGFLADMALNSIEPANGTITTPRPEVMAFAWLMEAKLAANDHKGGWENDSVRSLIHRIHDELHELDEAYDSFFLNPGKIPDTSAQRIIDEAVDVANFAMMVVDNMQQLTGKKEPK